VIITTVHTDASNHPSGDVAASRNFIRLFTAMQGNFTTRRSVYGKFSPDELRITGVLAGVV